MNKKIFISIVLTIFCMFQSSAYAKNTEIYDIHQHYIPNCYKEALLQHGIKETESDGLPTPDWSVEKQLKTMDSLGIKTAFITLATPHPYWGDIEETRTLVRNLSW